MVYSETFLPARFLTLGVWGKAVKPPWLSGAGFRPSRPKKSEAGGGFPKGGGPPFPPFGGGGGAALRPIEYGFWRSQNATGAEPRPPRLQNNQG